MTLDRQSRRLLFALLLILTISIYLLVRHREEDTLPRLGDTPPRPEDTPSRLAILSMTTSETSYDWMAISNRHEYAKRHDYDLIWDFSTPRDYAKVWDKIGMIREAFQSTVSPSGKKKYKWLLMLDFDTLITNPAIRLEDIINQSLDLAVTEGKRRDDIQLILTRDCEPLNAGILLFKVSSSPWMLEFLDKWQGGRRPENPTLNEQDVLRVMLVNNVLGTADKSVVVPQTMFNAYPEEIHQCRDERDSRSWEPGMFLVHFAGARWWYKEEADPIGRLMRKYYHIAFPEGI